MAKKCQTVGHKYRVRVLSTDSQHPTMPVVFEFFGVNSFGQPLWLLDRTYPIGTDGCSIEEVPEEPIGVGYSWTKNGRLFKVVHEAPTGKAYLVVTENKDQTQSLAWGSVDHWYTEYWWKESDIRQASET